MNYLNRYRNHIQSVIWEGRPMDTQNIYYWRHRLFLEIIIYFLPLGTLGSVVGLATAICNHMPMMAVADAIIWGLILLTGLHREFNYKKRAMLFIAILYCLAINMIINIGIHGPGILWFMCSAILAALLFETAWYRIVSWNIGIYAVVAIAASRKWLVSAAMNDAPLSSWVSNGIAAIVITVIIVTSIQQLIKGLESKINSLTKAQNELMESREALIHTRKMDAIGRLAGSIAHDFNNMLTGIRGFAEMLQMHFKEDDKHTFYCQEIIKTTEMAAEMTNHLLTFSRNKSEKKKIVDVNQVVRDAVELVRYSLAPQTTLKIIQDNTSLNVYADPEKIQNAILNLAINARDAMGEKGGTIQVKTEQIELEEMPPSKEQFQLKLGQGYVRILIEDQGCGMEDEVKTKIFEPFFTTKSTGRGTGLGLATVYGTVVSHEGGIFVESIPGEGSRFEVLLPMCSYESKEKA